MSKNKINKKKGINFPFPLFAGIGSVLIAAIIFGRDLNVFGKVLGTFNQNNYVEQTIKINFQSSSVPSPEGYLLDHGQVFGDSGNGYSYGWLASNTAETRDRGLDQNPDVTQVRDTITHLKTNTWEFALPEGANNQVTIKILAGDPKFKDQTNTIDLEGQILVDQDPQLQTLSYGGDFDDYETSLSITDGKITLKNATEGVNSKIAAIEITYSTGTPPVPVVIRDFELPSGKDSAGNYRQITSLSTGVSGIQASRNFAGKVWTIADHQSHILKLIEPSETGNEYGQWKESDPAKVGLSFANATNKRSGKDYEDLAIGAGPVSGQNYLYIANIGWNNSYNNPRIHRMVEPTAFTGSIPASEIQTFEFNYQDLPTGSTADAETFMVDQVNGDIFIVIKGGSQRYLYKLTQADLNSTVPVKTAVRLGVLDIAPVFEQDKWQGARITGGDIAPNNQEIILRSDKWGIHYYQLMQGETIEQALLRKPNVSGFEQLSNKSGYTDTESRSKYAENLSTGGQSEAITFKTDNTGFYEMSEGSGASWGGRVLYIWKWK